MILLLLPSFARAPASRPCECAAGAARESRSRDVAGWRGGDRSIAARDLAPGCAVRRTLTPFFRSQALDIMTLLRILSLLLAVADGLTAITDDNLKDAVAAWLADSKKAETTYGDIGAWDVSRVTEMFQLFLFQGTFNADISKWDTSKVTSMPFMRAHSVANSFRRAPRRATRRPVGSGARRRSTRISASGIRPRSPPRA